MRITNQDLLLSGWHGILTCGKQFWSHPDLCHAMVRFHEAARIEKEHRSNPLPEWTRTFQKMFGCRFVNVTPRKQPGDQA